MKKVAIYFLLLIMVTSCVACSRQNEVENQETNTTIQEGLTEKNKIISNDFNEETNKTITLQKLKLEIPDKWEYITDEVGALHFSPDKEVPPFFSFVIMPTEEKLDFKNPKDQSYVAYGIIKTYISSNVTCKVDDYYVPMEYFTLSSGKQIDVTGRYVLTVECSGTIYNQKYKGKIMVFYIDGEMCVFNLFQALDSVYDFSKEMDSIVKSVATIESKEPELNKESNTNQNVQQDTSKIKVSFVKDSINGNDMLLKVYVKNLSESKFNGDVHVYFYSADRKTRLGYDTIIVKDLMPGQQSWSNVTIDKYSGTPLLETEFANEKFIDIGSSSNVLDDYRTEKTNGAVRLNFDIASWYRYIKSIKVYTDGTCEVIVTPSSDDTVIASSVWSCGHEYGVKNVKVIDSSGKLLTVFSR